MTKLGQISVLFYKIENVRPKEVGDVTHAMHSHDAIPEKALKGSFLTHSAQ